MRENFVASSAVSYETGPWAWTDRAGSELPRPVALAVAVLSLSSSVYLWTLSVRVVEGW